MLISHKRRFVYIAPPKTASTTLHHWLSQPALCEAAWDPDPDLQHATAVPEPASSYFTFASIRHPCARAVSLWAHSQAAGGRACGIPQMTFGEFLLHWQPTAGWFYCQGQADFLAGVRLDALVRMERLETDLLTLPPIRAAIQDGIALEPLPRLNPTAHPPVDALVTADLRELLIERWPADFALFAFAEEYVLDRDGHVRAREAEAYWPIVGELSLKPQAAVTEESDSPFVD